MRNASTAPAQKGRLARCGRVLMQYVKGTLRAEGQVQWIGAWRERGESVSVRFQKKPRQRFSVVMKNMRKECYLFVCSAMTILVECVLVFFLLLTSLLYRIK